MIYLDGYYSFLMVGGCLVVCIFLTSSLIIMVLGIVFYSVMWFFYMAASVNYFVWGSLLTLLYLGSMMVLFTYSIMLTGVVSGDFKLLVSGWDGSLFLFLCFLMFYFLGLGERGSGLLVSFDDQVYHFYSGVFVILSAVVLVSVLFFCIVELVEDYV